MSQSCRPAVFLPHLTIISLLYRMLNVFFGIQPTIKPKINALGWQIMPLLFILGFVVTHEHDTSVISNFVQVDPIMA